MTSYAGKLRSPGVSELSDTVDLAKLSRLAKSDDVDSSTQEACEALASKKTLLGPEQCAAFSRALGFDATRLCAAHNVVVASKYADSLRISSLYQLLEGLVASQDEVEGLLVEMITQPQSELSGALIDEVAKIVRFRPHAPRDREWAEGVYLSL